MGISTLPANTTTFGNGYPVYDSARIPTFVLTNSSKGNESESLAFSLFKSFDAGLDIRFGYAWTDAKDVNPMTSSVAFSNYVNRAFYDPEEEVLSTSNYNIEHRFTGVLNYTANWFGEYRTRVSLYGQAASGVPYSTVLGGADGTIGLMALRPTSISSSMCSKRREPVTTITVAGGARWICASARSFRGFLTPTAAVPF